MHVKDHIIQTIDHIMVSGMRLGSEDASEVRERLLGCASVIMASSETPEIMHCLGHAVRLATFDDRDAIVDIFEAADRELASLDPGVFEPDNRRGHYVDAAIADPASAVLVAVVDGEVVGSAVLCGSSTVADHPASRVESRLYLADLAVRGTNRRSGVASSLCDAAVRIAVRMGIREVVWTTFAANLPAAEFIKAFPGRAVCTQYIGSVEAYLAEKANNNGQASPAAV